MTNSEQLAETLNDLVKINNDRIVGYEKAVKELSSGDVDLKATFLKMADESRGYVAKLNEYMMRPGDKPAADTKLPGMVYRVWMDVKNTFTGTDRKSILESCELGEDAAQKAYGLALESDTQIDADTRLLITEQKNSFKTSQDIIKKYRDMLESPV